eukprot:3764278-Rhodomonas_salina.4
MMSMSADAATPETRHDQYRAQTRSTQERVRLRVSSGAQAGYLGGRSRLCADLARPVRLPPEKPNTGKHLRFRRWRTRQQVSCT